MSTYPIFDMATQHFEYRRNEERRAPMKKVLWRMRRGDHKGKLLALKRSLSAFKLKGRTSELGQGDHEHIPSDVVVMVVDYIPITRVVFLRNHKGEKYDTRPEDMFAYLVLHRESVYLVEEDQMRDHDKPVEQDPQWVSWKRNRK